MKTLIIGNGRIDNYISLQKYVDEADYIICADGGSRHVRKFGLKPDVIIGDLDSSLDPDIKFFKEIGVVFEKHPVEKDKTDMEICIEKAHEQSTDVIILGATGGRADHYIANVLMISNFVDLGMEILIADEYNEIRVLSDKYKKEVEITGTKSEFISLIPLTETVVGVSTVGLKYELTKRDLTFGSTFSISNNLNGKKATVSFEKGKMLLVKSKDA